MCIYCGTDKYRKIYEQHHGKIPLDETGKKFHIHHLDGNHKNHHPDNLIALSEKDHFRVHFEQGDFGAASRLARRKYLTAEERSELARLSILDRMSRSDYVNPSSLEEVNIKQKNSAKFAWSCDDGSRRKLVNDAMNSDAAKKRKIETWNKKSPIYHLVNLSTDEEVKMTRYDFIHNLFDGKLSGFNDIVPNKKTGKARRKTIKGWKLLDVIHRVQE